MDLRQLQYLVSVVDEGGFRAAARRLHIAQPPLSTTIRQLERELGVPLLERTPRGTTPTPAGVELVVRARAILGQVDDARLSISRRTRSVAMRTLRVAVLAGPLAAGELTAPLFAALRDCRPDVDIVTEETTFTDQLSALKDGLVDIALVRPPLSDASIEFVPIAEEPRCLVVGASNPLAGAEEIALEEALRQPMLALAAPEEWSAYWQLDAQRGGPNVYVGAAAVGSVNATQMALMTTRAAITVSESTTRLASSPYITAVRITGIPPSVTAVAYRRGDTRREIQQYVEAIAGAAERNIHLLPGGKIPA
jgi:DNA-binding transcriptional LysR family regulator